MKHILPDLLAADAESKSYEKLSWDLNVCSIYTHLYPRGKGGPPMTPLRSKF